MPLHVSIDTPNRTIKLQGSGTLTDADLAGAHEMMESYPASEQSFARLCDLTEVADINVSNESLDAWAGDPISNPPVRHAIICNAASTMKLVLDYIRLSRKQYREISIFPDSAKALRWLNNNNG